MKLLYRICNNRCILLLIFVLIYLIRFLYLDSDVKNFELAQVQPIDELFYNEVGINMYHNGLKSLFSGDLNDVSVANSKLFLIPSLITYLSMIIFGNNFFGLKMGYVVMGLLVGLLMILICDKINKRNKWAVAFVAVFYLFDFNILMLSREAVTVMPCMLATVLHLTGLLYINRYVIRFFFNGFFPVIAFCLIYGGIPFLLVFSGLYALYIFYRLKKYKILAIYVMGLCFGLFICEIVDITIYRTHVWDIVIDTLFAHGGKVSAISIRNYFANLIEYFVSNSFRYNYLILVLFLWSSFISLYNVIKKQDDYLLIIFGLLLTHIMQIVFLPNMTMSKAAITFPVVLLFISTSFKYGILIGENKYRTKMLFMFLMFLGLLLQVYGLQNCISITWLDRYVVCFSTGIIFILLSIHIFRNKQIYLGFSCLVSISILIFLSIRYVFLNVTYDDRNMMCDMNIVIGEVPVLNAKGFRLYNNIHSLADGYDRYKDREANDNSVENVMIKETLSHKEIFFLSFDEKKSINEFNKKLRRYDVQYVKVKDYKRNYCSEGRPCNMYLFKKSIIK